MKPIGQVSNSRFRLLGATIIETILVWPPCRYLYMYSKSKVL